MNGENELSYCELRAKEIININDGRRLGRIVDMIFSCEGNVKGIIVPYMRRSFFSRNQDIFIPWDCIHKIGEDVILVKLNFDSGFHNDRGRRRKNCYDYEHHDQKEKCDDDRRHNCHDRDKDGCRDRSDKYNQNAFCCDFGKKEEKSHQNEPKCDHKCEKCMLFDCEYRWKDGYDNNEQIIVDNKKYK